MYRFDSRKIGSQDSMIHKFEREGEFKYGIFTERSLVGEQANQLCIRVSPCPPEVPKEHKVLVRHHAQSRQYHIVDGNLDINIGDSVRWCKLDDAGEPFYIQIYGGDESEIIFDSRLMRKSTVYAHRFLAPGKYIYGNELSSREGPRQSKAQEYGEIIVRDVGDSLIRNYNHGAAMVYFKNGCFNPNKIIVPNGGTVVWHIEDDSPAAVVLSCYSN